MTNWRQILGVGYFQWWDYFKALSRGLLLGGGLLSRLFSIYDMWCCFRCPVLLVTGEKSVFNTTTRNLHRAIVKTCQNKSHVEFIEIPRVANIFEENPSDVRYSPNIFKSCTKKLSIQKMEDIKHISTKSESAWCTFVDESHDDPQDQCDCLVFRSLSLSNHTFGATQTMLSSQKHIVHYRDFLHLMTPKFYRLIALELINLILRLKCPWPQVHLDGKI